MRPRKRPRAAARPAPLAAVSALPMVTAPLASVSASATCSNLRRCGSVWHGWCRARKRCWPTTASQSDWTSRRYSRCCRNGARRWPTASGTLRWRLLGGSTRVFCWRVRRASILMSTTASIPLSLPRAPRRPGWRRASVSRPTISRESSASSRAIQRASARVRSRLSCTTPRAIIYGSMATSSALPPAARAAVAGSTW